MDEDEVRKPLSPRPTVSPISKDADLEDELLDDEVDLADDADETDEDVEEELTLDGEDEDSDFLEKPESLLEDSDDYHTH